MRYLILLLFIVGCALPKSAVVLPPKESDKVENFERREPVNHFQSTGVVKYFLPNLPDWANFVGSTNCRRQKQVRFIDFEAIRASFGLTYKDAVLFQALFNQEYAKLLTEMKLDTLPFKDEEALFYRVSEKIQGGLYPFMAPTYKKVSLLWIDPLLQRGNIQGSLNSLMKNRQVLAGHPVVISLCLSSSEMNSLLQSYMLDDQNIRIISAEYFTAFDVENRLKPHYFIDLTQFFDPSQEIRFFTPTVVPKEITGPFYDIKL